MTGRQAQRVVLTSLLVLVLVRSIGNARNPRTALVIPRELFGAVGVAMVLSAMTEVAPSAAAGLAATAAVTGTIAAGPDLFNSPTPRTPGDSFRDANFRPLPRLQPPGP